MAATQDAAAGLLEEISQELADTEQPVETPAAETEVEAEASLPALDVELPADVAAILEDDDEEPVETVAQAVEEPDEDTFDLQDEPWEEESGLKRQLSKLTKERDYLRKQHLKGARKEWESEIGQYFPFADAKEIAATAESRRAALRSAKAQHDVARRGAEAVAQHYETKLDQIVEERMAREREQLQAMWGRPIGGPGQAPTEAAARSQETAEIQNARTLKDRTLLKLKSGAIQL